jgi:hypothetical protein
MVRSSFPKEQIIHYFEHIGITRSYYKNCIAKEPATMNTTQIHVHRNAKCKVCGASGSEMKLQTRSSLEQRIMFCIITIIKHQQAADRNGTCIHEVPQY